MVVEAECKSNPELTIVENIGDTEVFIEVLTTEYRGVNTPVEEAIGPGEEIVFETGTEASGPNALGRSHIYNDQAVDAGEEGPRVITDAGEFSGDCID